MEQENFLTDLRGTVNLFVLRPTWMQWSGVWDNRCDEPAYCKEESKV